MTAAPSAPPAFATERFLARDLAEWAATLTFDDLSPESIAHAKRFWLDSLACAAGGSQTEDARILLEHHRALAPPAADAPCGVFVGGLRTNPVDAAFLNSHMVRALDFNDIYWQADPAHPSDLICAPLALCESLGRSGRELILATVIVYELQCRFAEIGRPGIREYGWHHATLSGFAAPIGAGRVLELSPDRLVHAMGISASRTGTLGAVTAGELTMMKNTVDPWAARMGVESALLAARGYTGPAHIIDGKEGLFHTMRHAQSGGAPCGFDADGLTRELPRSPADDYRITRCGMKSFPVEALMHAPLSAIGAIRNKHRFACDDVREIRVEVIARAADILGDPAKYRPTTRETADHSLPYAIAAMLADGRLTPAQFDPERVRDPALIPLMDAVHVVPNASFESRFPAEQPSRVTITLADGRSHTGEVSHPKGDPRHPMSDDELHAKLRSLASPVLGEHACDAIAAIVRDLDALDDVATLTRAMQGGTGV
ncbi:MAG: MmgE/PrpD family protein [Phycisphaerales bacterium]|nr:MAG: MmgE/PrpD family protein [Phycisphaerales bacterium]